MRIWRKWLLPISAASFLLAGHTGFAADMPITHAQETTNRYEVAGITDPDAFEAFYGKLQKWVGKGNKSAIARHVQYPLRVNREGQSRFITDEKQFLAQYDQIMTEKVKQALLQQEVKDTFVNYQGVMVGSGELWLRQSGNNFVIVAINQ